MTLVDLYHLTVASKTIHDKGAVQVPLELQIRDLQQNDIAAYHLLQITNLLPSYVSITDLQYFWREWTKIFKLSTTNNVGEVVELLLEK